MGMNILSRITIFVACTGLVILYATLTEIGSSGANGGAYVLFQDIHVMVFVAFGFLLTAFERNSFTALGHSLLVAAFSALWAVLTRAFWARAIQENQGTTWDKEKINIQSIIGADFAALAVLITFGALYGRVSATQMLLVAFFEVILYALNEGIILYRFGATDAGGSMTIHMFGAFFAIAVSFVLNFSAKHKALKPAGTVTYMSGVTSAIGTLFMWVYYPSFNAARTGPFGERAFVNTYLSLIASTIGAFVLSTVFYDGKFRWLDVTRATIAGGVAMGTCAPLDVGGFGHLLIGTAAGFVSVIGFRFVNTPNKKYVKDTMGVISMHLLPGVIGAIAGIIAARSSEEKFYGNQRVAIWLKLKDKDTTDNDLAGYQVASIVLTMCISLIGGAVTGGILHLTEQLEVHGDDKEEYKLE